MGVCVWHLCGCVLLCVISVHLGWRQLSWMYGAVWDSDAVSECTYASGWASVRVCV